MFLSLICSLVYDNESSLFDVCSGSHSLVYDDNDSRVVHTETHVEHMHLRPAFIHFILQKPTKGSLCDSLKDEPNDQRPRSGSLNDKSECAPSFGRSSWLTKIRTAKNKEERTGTCESI